MGEVYRARDSRLGREIAIKVLPADMAQDPERLARFEREARTVAALNHPNIVTLHAIEDAGSVRFLVMELVEGESLDRSVTPGGLPLERALRIARELTAALEAAHARGVVHRDLKPANIMLTVDGRVKVLDFGLAKSAADAPSLDSTQAATVAAPLSTVGQVLGTVPYMAPEQVRAEEADARTDLHAVGVVLHELVAGVRPYGGATAADVASAILRDAPPALRTRRAEAPAALESLVLRCLAKAKAERFGSASELLAALRAVSLDAKAAGATPPATPAEEAPSIAVLPFVNMSRDEENEYFSDGLAEELLNVLAKIRGLRVAGRTSSFQFKGQNTDVSVIGQRLGVATVLEGSVRKSGARVRISVQLVKVADGFQLWSETYDRTLDDIFALQDDIAQSVVKELRTTLLGQDSDSKASGEVRAEVAIAARGRGTNPEAHRLFMLGRHLSARYVREDNAQAILHLEQAIALDPEYAIVHVELARARIRAAEMGWFPLEEMLAQARVGLDLALAMDPSLPEAVAGRGWIELRFERNWDQAKVWLERADALDTESEFFVVFAGGFHRALGQFAKAEAYFRQALLREPLSSISHMNLAILLDYQGRLEESRELMRRCIVLAPGNTIAVAHLAQQLVDIGEIAEAQRLAASAARDAFGLSTMAIVHHAAGDRAASDAALVELLQIPGGAAALSVASVHAQRRENDDAFRWLERAVDLRAPWLTDIRFLVAFRPLHGDPRWGAFIERMGFPA
jgi:TolB-like protein/Tfp pilus assembly protein PilF